MRLFQKLALHSTPERISRAVSLVARGRIAYVTRFAEGVYKAVVIGDSGYEHIVFLSEDGERYKCTCFDYARNSKPCKHILAVAFYLELQSRRQRQSKPPSSRYISVSRDHHPPRAKHGSADLGFVTPSGSANSAVITA